MVGTADQVWADADGCSRSKQPIAAEYGRPDIGQIFVLTFLHLGRVALAIDVLLIRHHVTAYETVQTADGALPLLWPLMSEVAGRLAASGWRYHLMRTHKCGADGRGARRRTGRDVVVTAPAPPKATQPRIATHGRDCCSVTST